MITIKNLSKVYKIHKKEPGFIGSVKSLLWRRSIEKHAIRSLSLDIQQGEIVGLLGANGAGKTTLVKLLAGIIHPTSGTLEVLGFRPWERKNEYRRQIALLMGPKAQLWWDLPAADCFLLLREIYQVPKDRFDNRLRYLSQTLGIQDLLTTQLRRLSLGERMKMELVAALLHQPQIVFLDEPTIGLDLTSQRAMRKFLLEYHEQFQLTMVVTSHYMEDIENLCKKIFIIREGELVFDGYLDELRKKYATHKVLSAQLATSHNAHSGQIRTLSDLNSDILENTGEVVEHTNTRLKVRVRRELAPKVAAEILAKLPVTDLTIEEMDVGTIIAAIQSGLQP